VLGEEQLVPLPPARGFGVVSSPSGVWGRGPENLDFWSTLSYQKSCQNAHCLRSNIAGDCADCASVTG